MDYNSIRKMAKKLNINTYRMKKPELIRAVQRAEDNIDCFGSLRVNTCREDSCLWRADCLALNPGRRP